MRIKRQLKRYRRQKKQIATMIVFFIIIPSVALLSAIAIIKTYTGSFNSNNKYAFNYIIDQNPIILYRINIEQHDGYDAAIKTVDGIKDKNLNAFILKESGYVVTFGIYSDEIEAQAAKSKLDANQIQSSIIKIEIPDFNLLYEKESSLIEDTKNIDSLILELINIKSKLSIAMLEQLQDNQKDLLNSIYSLEDEFENCHIAKDYKIEDNEIETIKEKYLNLLKEISKYRIQKEQTNNYYSIQNSLLNQVELIQNFRRELLLYLRMGGSKL